MESERVEMVGIEGRRVVGGVEIGVVGREGKSVQEERGGGEEVEGEDEDDDDEDEVVI